VAARSKAWVYGSSPADTVGSNPTGDMGVCCECCVLSGRGLCVGLITRPEESYRMWCVVVGELETSWMRRPWPTGGVLRQKKNYYYYYYHYYYCYYYYYYCSRDSAVRRILGYTLHDPRFDSRQEQRIFLSSKTSRPVQKTVHPSQWVPRFLPG